MVESGRGCIKQGEMSTCIATACSRSLEEKTQERKFSKFGQDPQSSILVLISAMKLVMYTFHTPLV